ncbi:beta-N-acetylhexosaminidase [Tenggerimyces flavus]|uniref:beta-N-acetylhexosaminidase n=1 Tax=Tenggerimyces flavus TaxID=1708749 RepID=A0ABV7YLC6_9ACTN|nr:beta-N-acetylhexosaminidase [Tenggerimyces flavus]MBM7789865.1 hexosaminidase [Tenggerimyces flavus]
MIPLPQRFSLSDGRFAFAPAMRLTGPPDLTALVRQELGDLGVGWCETSTGEIPALAVGLDPALAREGYVVRISADAVQLSGGSAAGVFYGLQTLRQLLPASALRRAQGFHDWSLPGGEIADEPSLSWRGLMMDAARHFMPKDFLFKLIDLLALHKLNVLQLHLTDDEGWRFDCARYPLLTSVGGWRPETRMHAQPTGDGTPHGGFYTQDDLAEIVAYAARRFVTVVPEIELPAHAAAAIRAYPALGTAEPSTVLNVEDSTLSFVFDVLDEVLAVFPSEFVHVGGDEVPPGPWERDPGALARMRALGLTDAALLRDWFMGEVGRWLSARGRRMVTWGGLDPRFAPPNAAVMSWQSIEAGVEAVRSGRDAVMAPASPTYFDAYQSESDDEPMVMGGLTTVESLVEYAPVPPSLSAAEAERILGTQSEIWTEYLPTPARVEYMVFPRLCAFAEAAWRTTQSRSYADFLPRLRAHLPRLDALGVNYRPLDGPHPWQRGGTGRFRRPR